MSIDKKAFGISDSLIQAVNEALKGNQHKIDVAEPKGKITSADFKKLRGEELIGGQKKLDKNHNGKLDKQDFKMLRKEEVVDEGNPANKAKKNAAAAAVGAQNRDAHHNAKRGMRTDVADKIRGREVMQGQPRVRHEEVEVTEADNAVAKQIAAKKDAFKKQLQQKIAAKQMNTMQAKANKRLANIHASNSKCTCGEGKKSMSCEVCNGDKGMKGGKEQIIVNPPMREAAELPKKVITKGHEIAKSIIKHKGKVDNPYAVGMAAAKKSAGVKEEAEQVDEVLDSPIKKMAYIMKAKKSIEKSDPKKIKQANDIANRVIGIKRVMNKVNKKD